MSHSGGIAKAGHKQVKTSTFPKMDPKQAEPDTTPQKKVGQKSTNKNQKGLTAAMRRLENIKI
jgi:hypothetical protein